MIGAGKYAGVTFDDKPTEKVAAQRRTTPVALATVRDRPARTAAEVPTEKVATGLPYSRKAVALSKLARKQGGSLARVLPWVLCALVTIGAGFGVFYMHEKYRLAQDELVEANQAMQAARQEMTAADNKIMSLQAEVSRLRGEFTARNPRTAVVEKSADSAPRTPAGTTTN